MNFISENHKKAWNSALAVLNPTKTQLEHGLELHQTLFAMDHFGFLQTDCYSHKLVTRWNERKAQNVGQWELSRRIEFMHFDEICRNPECAARFRTDSPTKILQKSSGKTFCLFFRLTDSNKRKYA